MDYNNQSGDGSINAGSGDFRGANFQVGDNNYYGGVEKITPGQLEIKRKFVLPKSFIKRKTVVTLSSVGSVASIIGLFSGVATDYPLLLFSTMGLFTLSVPFLAASIYVKRTKFSHFLFNRYIEVGSHDLLSLSKIRCTCPYCGNEMHLSRVKLAEKHYDDFFICTRNPGDHRIKLDFTCLAEIKDN